MRHFLRQTTCKIMIIFIMLLMLLLIIPNTVFAGNNAGAAATRLDGGGSVSIRGNIADMLRGKNPEPDKIKQMLEDIESFDEPDFSAPEAPNPSASETQEPSSEVSPGDVSAEGTVSAESTIYIKTGLTLSSNKTYSGTVVLYPYTGIDMNHKTLTVNGDLIIFGCIDVKGGTLRVNGDLIISNGDMGLSALLNADGGVVNVYGDIFNDQGTIEVNAGAITVYKSSAASEDGNFINEGSIRAESSADIIKVDNGFFYTGAQYNTLSAGTLDINGDFFQDSGSFRPYENFNVIIRGIPQTPRTVYFSIPSLAYFSNYELTDGTVLTDDSVISIYKALSSDTTLSVPNGLVYFAGNLNGHTLTANCVGGFILTPESGVRFNKGEIIANCDSGFGENCYVYMQDSADKFYANGDFVYALSAYSKLEKGTLELGGDFYQINTSSVHTGNAFCPKQEFVTQFDKAGAKVSFQDTEYSHFTKLILSNGASFTPDSVICLYQVLQQDVIDTPLNYPNLHLSGDLNGHTLTVGCDFTFGFPGINVNGGRLIAMQDVTANYNLNMAKDVDYVCVYGDYTSQRSGYWNAGTIVFKGNVLSDHLQFNYSGEYDASGTHKAVFDGPNKKVVVSASSNLANIEIAEGTTFTSDSCLSLQNSLTSDLTIDIPTLYYSGNLNGHTLFTTGDLNSNGINFNKGTVHTGKDFFSYILSMIYPEDTIYVDGNFKVDGYEKTNIKNGTIYIKGNFIQKNTYSPKSFVASSPNKTVFCGTDPQTITFDSPASSKFGIVEIANDKVTYTALPCDSMFITCTNLSGISAPGGELYPSISNYQNDYIVTVPKDTTSTTLSVTTPNGNEIVTMDGTIETSKEISDIPYGGNIPVQITVTTPGSMIVKTYNVKVEQLNTNIEGIGLTNCTLDKPFGPDTLAYNIELPAYTESIGLAPVTGNPDSSLTIDGQDINSKIVAINPGETKTCVIRVTGQDGATTKDYTFTIHRAPLIGDIVISGGTLSPDFAYALDSYTVDLPIMDSDMTISVSKSADCDTLTMDGIEQNSMEVSLPDIGQTKTVTIIAKAASSSVTHTYTVKATRTPLLVNLGQPADSTLSQAYAPTAFSYTLTVPSSMANVTLSPAISSYCDEIAFKYGDSDYIETAELTVHPIIGETIPVSIRVKDTADGIEQTYTVNVLRQPIVTNITSAEFPDSFDFSPTVLSYNMAVPTYVAITSFNVVGAHNSTPSLSLYVGETKTLNITVQSADHLASITYSITVTRVPKPLNSITVSYGSSSESFNASSMNNNISISATTKTVTVSAVKNDNCSKLEINGVEAESGIGFSPPLGNHPCLVKATDKNSGIVTTYYVYISRFSLLDNITTSVGTLYPAFDPETDHYTLIMPANTDKVTIGLIQPAVNINAWIIGEGSVISVPKNTHKQIIVTTNIASFSNEISSDYIVDIYNMEPLSGIQPTSGTLSPAFKAGVSGYTVTLPATVSSATITPVLTETCKSMTIDGENLSSKTFTLDNPGESTSSVISTVAIDNTIHIYNITIKRAPLITSIKTSLSKYPVSPVFNPTTTSYTIDIPATVSQITLTPVKASSGVKSMTINGRSVSYITLKPAIGGSATANIIATATDGITNSEYTVTVRRAPLVTDIDVSSGILSFSPTALTYTVDVPADISNVTITETPAASGVKSVTINGVSQTSVNLVPPIGGTAKATIIGTATDGRTKVTYTVVVRRAPIISGIIPDVGSMSPIFNVTNTSYTISLPSTVSSCTLTPVKAADCDTLLINGDELDSLTVHPLIGESVSVAIEGRTALGTNVTYNVTVKRAALITNIKSGSTKYPLSSVFNPTTMDYTIYLPASASSIKVYITKGSEVKTLTINGLSVSSYTAKPAIGGTVVITVNAIAKDGITSVTYTITVHRASS